MTAQIDPERNESKHLHRFADLADRRVLEIGCGEGRLTWNYARAARQTVGIDPDLDALRVAKVDRPYDLESKTVFACAMSEYLPFSKATFDLAIFAWSF
jgi:ubiquinone/menaquinone biosynthesis C-methylase UbiE